MGDHVHAPGPGPGLPWLIVIDLRTLREEPDVVRASQRARGEDVGVVDRLLSLDAERRSAIAKADNLRAEQKQLGKRIGKASGEEREALLARGKELAAQVKEAEAEQNRASEEFEKLYNVVPNIVHPDVPEGGEDDYVVLKHVGTPREFDFTPKDHLELGEALGAIDTERGAKVSGARFYFLTGVGAQLQLALLNIGGGPGGGEGLPAR